jgi:hypothetical protein
MGEVAVTMTLGETLFTSPTKVVVKRRRECLKKDGEERGLDIVELSLPERDAAVTLELQENAVHGDVFLDWALQLLQHRVCPLRRGKRVQTPI